MAMDETIRSVADRFCLEGTMTGFQEIKTGHINRSYRLRCETPDGGVKDYVLQRINVYVFKKPEEVMDNVCMVTDYLAQAMVRMGQDPTNRVLKLIPAREGGYLARDDEGGHWRVYDFISHAHTVDQAQSLAQFREIGRAFGDFQSMLSGFPIDSLHETIPSFHDTRKRLGDFRRSVEKDVCQRADGVRQDIDFILQRGPAMCRIVEMIEEGALPLRVTHNDTKINNVMLDIATDRALCVIDLDTVMPGSVLYDFGDAIRVGACTATEDERDLSRVSLDMDLFSAFSEGFTTRTANHLTLKELENLPLGAIVMTFENAMRFLADYLDGDVYYRIDCPDHNLARARCQMRLLSDMERREAEMYATVRAQIAQYRTQP